jgi:IS30 family transposase
MYKHFNNNDRVLLVFLLKKNLSYRKIAKELNMSVSSVSREIKRNSFNGRYGVVIAKKKSKQRRLNSKYNKRIIESNIVLRKKIIRYLKKYYSPEQISGILKLKYNINISTKTIYSFLKRSFSKSKYYLRHPKKRRNYGTKRFKKALKESSIKRIDKRSILIKERVRLGDFEGDTVILGGRKQRLLTLVDRKSGYLIIRKLVPDKKLSLSDLVVKETLTFKNKIKTITFDNGSEFAQYKTIEDNSNIDIYFAYPYHSWERGTNENTNGLIRQFFPKGMNGDRISLSNIKKIENLLNHRPRKRLNYLTPYEVFVEKKEPSKVLHFKG